MPFTILLAVQFLAINNLLRERKNIIDDLSSTENRIMEYKALRGRIEGLPVESAILLGSEESYSAFQYSIVKLSSIYKLRVSQKGQKVSSISIKEMVKRDNIGKFIPLSIEVSYHTISGLARFIEAIEKIFPVSITKMEFKEGKFAFDFKLYVK